MKVVIKTLGCKVNSYESELIKENFTFNGDEIIDDESLADVIIINTCSVTNQADAKSRKMIHSARRNNKDACLVVCGCSAEHNQETLRNLDVDILIGNKDKSKIVSLVNDWLNDKKQIVKFYDLRNVPFEDMSIKNFMGKTRGFVKIQDGCNNYCSYCVIPYLRGNIRSKDIDVAYEEIKCLVNNGYHEIVLTGIHTGSYGRGTNYDLVDLINRISELDGLKRIRISSIEITELDDKFMNMLKTNMKVVPHMHVPIQAGSNKVLKDMNRKYNIDEYIAKVAELRNIRSDMSITTDLIVGYPTEDDDAFNETVDTINKIKFTKIHTFPFSMRSGTKASLFKEINDKVKKNRVNKVLELSNYYENLYYQSFVGKEVEVLVEADNIGLTGNYMKVILDKNVPINSFQKVTIDSVDGLNIYGHIL